jgi:hypothetical protein
VPELERQFEQFQMEVEAAETARAAVLAALDATKAELAALKETTCRGRISTHCSISSG